MPDYNYNGHYGIRELCNICPLGQLQRCAAEHRRPAVEQLRSLAARLPQAEDLDIIEITDRAAIVAGLDEQPRYYLQHALGFQIHDVRHPHHQHRHGRADLGWNDPVNPPRNPHIG